MGFDKFDFSIIEKCDLNIQKEKENYYLPLLNTIFKSNLSVTQFYDSLYEILKIRQLDLSNKYAGVTVYLYEYINKHISLSYQRFSSINFLAKKIRYSQRNSKSIFKYKCTL